MSGTRTAFTFRSLSFTGRHIAADPRRAGPTVSALILGAALLLLAPLLAAAEAPPTPIVKVLEDGSRVEVTGTPGSDGKLVRSFRVQRAANSAATALHFLTSDLKAANGEIIDRGNVIVRDGAIGDGPQDFQVEIDNLKHPGAYTGAIEIRSPQMAGASQSVPLTVSVARTANAALAPETAKLTLKIATSCGFFTRLVLGPRNCPGDFNLAFTGPSPPAPQADLLLVRGDGSALSATAELKAAASDNVLTVHIGNGTLDPGHYKGRVGAVFPKSGERIEAPIEIDVRTAAWLPALLILVGVLLGRLQAFMTSSGNALVAADRQLERIQARASLLDEASRQALAGTNASIRQAIVDGDGARATALLGKEELCLQALEALATRRARRTFDADADKIAKDLVDAAAENEAQRCQEELEKLDAALAATNQGMKLSGPQHPVESTEDVRSKWPGLRAYAIVHVAPVFLQIVLLIGLCIAGLITLYVNNGATMGASIADWLTLIAWGLTADVASRTLPTLWPAK